MQQLRCLMQLGQTDYIHQGEAITSWDWLFHCPETLERVGIAATWVSLENVILLIKSPETAILNP